MPVFSALVQFALRSMPFFQRLRTLRLRIGKSIICCALIINFFPRCAITKQFLNVDLHVPVKK